MLVKKIVLKNCHGGIIENIENIAYGVVCGNYTRLTLVNDKTCICPNTLKFYEKILHSNKFVRIHKSHFVNLDMVKEYYINGSKNHVTMFNGVNLEIARRKKQLFISKLNGSLSCKSSAKSLPVNS